MRLSVIIPAAGASTRYRTDTRGLSKLDEDLGGKCVLQRSIELFHARPELDTVIVAGPADESAMDAFRLRHADRLALLGCTLVAGGAAQRWESVKRALASIHPKSTHVAIHDAARPAAPASMIDRVLDAARRFDAVIPVLEVSDSLKRIGAEPIDPEPRDDPLARILADADGAPPVFQVESSIDRARLVAVQTPQVFERTLLERAYAQQDLSSTDDAGLVERLGARVVAVPGDERNIKLTRPGDLGVLRAVLGVDATKDKATHKRF